MLLRKTIWFENVFYEESRFPLYRESLSFKLVSLYYVSLRLVFVLDWVRDIINFLRH